MFKKIYIEITNICNLKCKFCPETKRKKEFINIEKFEEIICKIKDYTNLVCLHVKGEPLLHPQFEDILNILEKYNLKTNITTNGTLIKDKIETIKKSTAIRQINFSLHSITQNDVFNENYLQDIFEYTRDLKNVIISYRLWNLKDIKNNKENLYIINKIKEFYNLDNLEHNLANKEFIKINDNMFINQDFEFSWPDINIEPFIEKGRCLALKDQLAILVDGTVVPCCLDNNGDIKLGNIFDETLKDILNKPSSLNIRDNFKNNIITHNLCKTCGFLQKLENKRKSI